MGNIGNTIKRFLSNKNTVTIIGVLLGVIVLYVGYNYRVSHAVDTISIPYAKKTINATNQITKEDVGTIEVLRSLVTSNKTLISQLGAVVNQTTPYCVSEGARVSEGSFFYQDQVKLCTNISNNVLKNMPDGYAPVSLSVDIHTTYGNSMYPNDYIDLYVRMQSDDGKLIYGKFISKLPIMDVRDSSGNSVFATSKIGTPAELLFAVPEDLYLLLKKATYLNNVTLVPVPGNATYTTTVGETKVESEYLRNEILKYTATIPDEVVD